MAKIRSLRVCPLCRTMSYRELALLAPFVREEETAESGWIVEEGAPTSGLILLQRGEARLVTGGGAEKEGVALGPGDFFGEFSLVNPEATRGVGVQAVEKCEYLRVDPSDYRRLSLEAPVVAARLAEGILRSLAEKMNGAKGLLQELTLEKPRN